MPGRDRLQEIVHQSASDLVNEANRLCEAANAPGQVTQDFVTEHAAHAHAAVDRAAEACRVLVREGD